MKFYFFLILGCLVSLLLPFESVAQKAKATFSLELSTWNEPEYAMAEREDWTVYKEVIRANKRRVFPVSGLAKLARGSGYPDIWKPRLQNLAAAISKADLKPAMHEFYKRGIRQLQIRMSISFHVEWGQLPKVFTFSFVDADTNEKVGRTFLSTNRLEGGHLEDVSDGAAREIEVRIREVAEKRTVMDVLRERKDRETTSELKSVWKTLHSYDEFTTFTPKQIELLEEISRAVRDMKRRSRD